MPNPLETHSPFHLVVNPFYLENFSGIAKLCDPNTKFSRKGRIYSGKFGIVTMENMGKRLDPISVAVKRIKNFGMTGFEYFDAITLLQSEGVPCASPVAATRERYLSRWVSGVLFMHSARVPYQLFDEYQTALAQKVGELKMQGKWDDKWFLDNSEDGFAVHDINSENPLDRFTAIDPVYSRPQF